jgi:S1-C subfamily serine protease
VGDFAWLVPYEDLEDKIVKLGVGISDSEEPEGVLVSSVLEGSSAALAKLEVDDVIVEIDGVVVKEMFDLTYALSGKTVGDSGVVTVVRGEERLALDVTYAVMPPPPE